MIASGADEEQQQQPDRAPEVGQRPQVARSVRRAPGCAAARSTATAI